MINKLDCPPGYDAANASIYDLAATCQAVRASTSSP